MYLKTHKRQQQSKYVNIYANKDGVWKKYRLFLYKLMGKSSIIEKKNPAISNLLK
jgi:hypothetical protein